MPAAQINLLDYDRSALSTLFAAWGYSDYYADLVWRALYQSPAAYAEGDAPLASLQQLQPELRQRLLEEATWQLPRCITTQESSDGTLKFLLQLGDGEQVETVLMPYRDRYTACISSQAGCAMGCVFCATGQMGFRRNLSAGEIIAQVLFARQAAARAGSGRKLRNVVMMGMGEPLHNYDATVTAMRILTEDTGLAMGPRYITISTVGLAPAIRRLAGEGIGVNLAVSLHGATDEERSALAPIARRWQLAELMDACRFYSEQARRRIFFEWTLIAGKNDTPEQAHKLAQLLRGMHAHVNLIPLNPTSEYGGAPSQRDHIARFKAILDQAQIPNTVRQRRGIDIDAGCGQLRQRTLEQSAIQL